MKIDWKPGEQEATIAFGWIQLWATSEKRPDSLLHFHEQWEIVRKYHEAQGAEDAARVIVEAADKVFDACKCESDDCFCLLKMHEEVSDAAAPFMKKGE